MNVNQINNICFSGVWGDGLTKKYQRNDGYRVYEFTHFYYPFKDETDDVINHVERVNNAERTYDGDAIYDRCILKSKCLIKERLPFTATEWKLYKKSSENLVNGALSRIETALNSFGLTKYLKHLK